MLGGNYSVENALRFLFSYPLIFNILSEYLFNEKVLSLRLQQIKRLKNKYLINRIL